MLSVTVTGINDLLYQGCVAVKYNGDEVRVRDTISKEVRPIMFQVQDPTNRTLMFPGRGNNPFQTMMELIWVLGARDNNITKLREFLPRADLYSDNPNTQYSKWRAGYPERIRNFDCTQVTGYIDGELVPIETKKDGYDQLKYVYDTLQADMFSRQAVMNLWDASRDTFEFRCHNKESHAGLLQTKDRPCTQSVMFSIRQNFLDCVVTMLSNDVIYGLSSINMYEFTVMQELLAKMLDVEIGDYYHFTNSLHVYNNLYDKMEQIINQYEQDRTLIDLFSDNVTYPRFKWSDFALKDDYNGTMHMFENIYSVLNPADTMEIVENSTNVQSLVLAFRMGKPEVFMQILFYELIYQMTMFGKNTGRYNWCEVLQVFKLLKNTDLKMACLYWCYKQYPIHKGLEFTPEWNTTNTFAPFSI